MNKKNIWQRSESDRKRVCSRKLTPLSTTNIQNSLFKDEKLWLATVRVSFWFFKVFRKKRRGDISLISCFNIIQLIRPNVLHRFVEIKSNKWYTLSVSIDWDRRRNCRVEIASFLIFTFALRINPGILIKTAQGPMSHIKCSSIYLLCSLVAYPLLILISWLYQKALGFYNDEYKRITLFSVLGIDIYRDALFPFGLLFAPNENISKHLLIALIVKIIYFLIIWATPVLFVIVAARRRLLWTPQGNSKWTDWKTYNALRNRK